MNRPVKRADFSGPPKPYPKTGTAPKEKKAISKNSKGDLPRLIKEADDALRAYVRKRDGDGMFLIKCCTCGDRHPLNKLQVGHYLSRNKMATRWDEKNVALQCVKCNCLELGKPVEFARFIDQKYGNGTAAALIEKAKQSGSLDPSKIQSIIKKLKEK